MSEAIKDMSEAIKDMVAMIEANAQSRPSLAEFEMAYQVRVAMDRIRCAIRVTEMSSLGSEENMEAIAQLADALDRLDAAERHFQNRWRTPVCPGPATREQPGVAGKNGSNRHNS